MARGATPLEVAVLEAERVRAAGGRVVTTNGCFDLLHAGHVDTLEGARALGDLLIVLINSDDSVRRFKGPTRPWLDQGQRALLLTALRPVDLVVVFDEDTPLPALTVLRPHVHVKGGSYLPERIAAQEALVRGWGGELVCLPLREGISTTELLRRIWRQRPAELHEEELDR